jgi:transcriptional regulator with XRE-family HTH domain
LECSRVGPTASSVGSGARHPLDAASSTVLTDACHYLDLMRRGIRGSGIPINPNRIRQARIAAGLSLAGLAGNDVSRTFIHQLENGVSRPSPAVLDLIARRTGKPASYFSSASARDPLKQQALAADLLRLAVRVHRLVENVGFSPVQKQSMKLLETALRQGAVLTRKL